MYAFISGKVFRVKANEIVINNNGIGYQVYMANMKGIKKDDDVLVYIHEQIMEDAHNLYGFLDESDYDLFVQLLKVKGVGCATLIKALSGVRSEDVVKAIENGDVAYMKRLPGIGAKTAQQIILDLKGKLVHDEGSNTSSYNESFSEVEAALKALGYKSGEINPILKKLPSDEQNVDVLVRKALNLLLQAKGG